MSNFLGKAGSWKRTTGTKVGTTPDGTIEFVELNYRGPIDDAAAFRAQWEEDTQCPIDGYSHLTLKTQPTVIQRNGPIAFAMLRFEGPAETEGGIDGDSAIKVRETTMRQTAELGSAEASKWAVYGYGAPTAHVSYTSTGRKSTHQYSSVLEDFTDPRPQYVVTRPKDDSDPTPPNELAQNVDYQVVEVSEIISQETEGDLWHITESHSLQLEMYTGTTN